MLVSRPLAEKRQMSAAVAPVAGRSKGTGFPASEQELLAVEKTPRAATSRSTSAFGRETPAVVGSTTMMSLPAAVGAAAGSEIISSEAFGGIMAREKLLEVGGGGLGVLTEGIAGGRGSAAGSGRGAVWDALCRGG